MANSRNSGNAFEYATVDTRPTSAGYFTNPVNLRSKVKKGASKLFFSIREATTDKSADPSALSVITVSVQFQCEGDPGWTDYVPLDGSSFAIGNRVELSDVGTGVDWRAGVVDDNYTSGSVIFGFDW
jgi:hypothetical protein